MPRNSRKIQILAGLATLMVVALAVATMPGRLSRAARLQDQSKPAEAPPLDTAKAAVIPVDADPTAAPPMPVELTSEPPPPRAPNAAPVAALPQDPEKAAEEFLARTRKEASDAVDALNSEVAQLRERLAKVEAGLARYNATLDALNANPRAPEGRHEEPPLMPAKTPIGGPEIEPVAVEPPTPAGGPGDRNPSPEAKPAKSIEPPIVLLSPRAEDMPPPAPYPAETLGVEARVARRCVGARSPRSALPNRDRASRGGRRPPWDSMPRFGFRESLWSVAKTVRGTFRERQRHGSIPDHPRETHARDTLLRGKAADLAIFKACLDGIDSGSDLVSFHIQVLTPLINLLAVTFLLLVAQMRQKGYCRQADFGIHLFGWAYLLLYFAYHSLAEDVFTNRRATRQFFHSIGVFGKGLRKGDAISQILNAAPETIFHYWVPQLFFVMVGGVICAMTGITLVRGSMLEKGRAYEAFVTEMEAGRGKG